MHHGDPVPAKQKTSTCYRHEGFCDWKGLYSVWAWMFFLHTTRGMLCVDYPHCYVLWQNKPIVQTLKLVPLNNQHWQSQSCETYHPSKKEDTPRRDGGPTPWPAADPGDQHPYKNLSDTSPSVAEYKCYLNIHQRNPPHPPNMSNSGHQKQLPATPLPNTI